MDAVTRARTRALNDQLRHYLVGGRVLVTPGVVAMGREAVIKVMAAIRWRPHRAPASPLLARRLEWSTPSAAWITPCRRTEIRCLLSARGDLFAVGAGAVASRDLTNTPGVDEDHPAWSPDDRTIAYSTDTDGEQQIAVRPTAGGVARSLTHFKTGYLYTPTGRQTETR